MRDFIAAFIGCFMVVMIGLFFLGGLIFTNIWGLILALTFILTVIVTVFWKQQIRLENLERKVDMLLNGEQD